MKKLLTILLLSVFSLGCKAQTPVYDITDLQHRIQDIPGVYYKDLNNLLDPFEGTYIYTNGTTTFKIVLLEPVEAGFLSEEQWETFGEDYKLKVKALMEEGNLNSENLQKMLLKLLKDKGLGDKIALYKATNSEATQWSRVTLDPNNSNNPPINTPCN